MATESKQSPIGAQLRQLADEIRVQIHLAGMEAKDTWAKLEPRLHDLERKLEAGADHLADGVARAGRELETEMKKLLGGLEKPQ